MKTRFRFEQLEVWQAARGIGRASHRMIGEFPGAEIFPLASQVRRVSGSVSSNTVEVFYSDQAKET